METIQAKTTAKDFFLWLGALVALYTSATALIALLFDYINFAYPDVIASFADPYAGSVRIEMSLLIVATPTALILFRIIRRSLDLDSTKAGIWIRRWGLMLTLFIAAVVALVDLVTLINTFLGGEITTRFLLKIAVVLLVSGGVFLHFLADLKGYWQSERKKVLYIGSAAAVLVFVTIVSGFFIIGSPSHFRDIRLDTERTSDLQSIQYQILTYFQNKRTVPPALSDLNDPLVGFIVPVDPVTGASYTYSVISKTSFKLCAQFNAATPDMAGRGATDVSTSYPTTLPSGYGSKGISDVWTHDAGDVCFTRTIDPVLYPAPLPASTVKGL